MSIFKRITQWFKSERREDRESRDEYRKLLLDLYSIAIDAIIEKNARFNNFVFSITPIDHRFSINIKHISGKYSESAHVNGLAYKRLTTNDKISYIENVLQGLIIETTINIEKGGFKL